MPGWVFLFTSMAALTTTERQILEKLFQMGGGYVLNFSDRSFADFFRSDVGIDIDDPTFHSGSNSKANRLRCFWRKADNRTVGTSILKLIEYIETQVTLGDLDAQAVPDELLIAGRGIGHSLLSRQADNTSGAATATFENGNISITLQKDIFDHVQQLLAGGHYFNAVEEAYKVVRRKLREVSGKERATDAFNAANYEKIFGRLPANDAEKDFFEGVKFLHMAIQYLRNEKAHTPAHELDKNMAIHYIALASLAYDLINS